jgi:hypothetical protein
MGRGAKGTQYSYSNSKKSIYGGNVIESLTFRYIQRLTIY